MIYISYCFGKTCVVSVKTGPVNRTHIISSIYDFMNSPGILHVATSLFYLASISQDKNIASVAMLGNIVSYFFLYTLLFIPLDHPQYLILTQLLCLNNIKYQRAFLLYYLVKILGYMVGPNILCEVASYTVGLPQIQIIQIF